MPKYSLVAPSQYSTEQRKFIDDLVNGIMLISEVPQIILAIRDIDSRYMIATNSYAEMVGFGLGIELVDKLDYDVPCKGIIKLAPQFINNDQDLLLTDNYNKSIAVLNVHSYSNEFKSHILQKSLIIHHASLSILGILYQGYNVELSDLLNLLHNSIRNNQNLNNKSSCPNQLRLTEYEQEICFLILQKWDFKQIAEFMNQIRPIQSIRTADTVIKKKNYLCNKFSLKTNRIEELEEFLVTNGFHQQIKIPSSLYSRLVGSIKFSL